MLDNLDETFTLLDGTPWTLDFFGDNDLCGLISSTREAISSSLKVTAIDAILYQATSSQPIFQISQESGKELSYTCLIQVGKNMYEETEGEASSVEEVLSKINLWLQTIQEPLL